MKSFKMPTAYTILFLIIIVVAVFTWIIPAGQYEYVDPDASRREPISGTYHNVDPNQQGLFDVLTSPFVGFYDAVDIALFILVIGGFLGVVMKTGAIDSGIANVIKTLKGKEKWMIPILMVLFGLGGTTFGMAEETIAFYPLLLPVFIAAGYDSITAVSVILLGAGVGVLGSTVNPFATGIASGFAGISLGDGIVLRMVVLIVLEIVAILYVMSYATKVKRDPKLSIVADMYDDNKEHFLHSDDGSTRDLTLTSKRKIILVLFALTFGVMIYSVIPFEDMGITAIPTLGWWFTEISALFFACSIIIGIFARLSEDDLISGFVSGAGDLLGVAFIIGISRGITVIMNSGLITDTILFWGEKALAGTGSLVFILLTYLFYIPLSFLIPSTSGLATLSMPIMAPLSDFAGIGRDLVITAFQSASGIVNIITPTSAVVMGGLAVGRISYDKWIKYVWKLVVVILILTMIALGVGSVL